MTQKLINSVILSLTLMLFSPTLHAGKNGMSLGGVPVVVNPADGEGKTESNQTKDDTGQGKPGSSFSIQGGTVVRPPTSVKGGNSAATISGGSPLGNKKYPADKMSHAKLLKSCKSNKTKFKRKDFSTYAKYKNYLSICKKASKVAKGKVKKPSHSASAATISLGKGTSTSSSSDVKGGYDSYQKLSLTQLYLLPKKVRKIKAVKSIINKKLLEYGYKGGKFSAKGISMIQAEVKPLPLYKIKKLPKFIKSLSVVVDIVASKKEDILNKYENGQGVAAASAKAPENSSSGSVTGEGSSGGTPLTIAGGTANSMQAALSAVAQKYGIRSDLAENQNFMMCLFNFDKSEGTELDAKCCAVLTENVKKSVLQPQYDQELANKGLSIAASSLVLYSDEEIGKLISENNTINIKNPTQGDDVVANAQRIKKALMFLSLVMTPAEYINFLNKMKSAWNTPSAGSMLRSEIISAKGKMQQAKRFLQDINPSDYGNNAFGSSIGQGKNAYKDHTNGVKHVFQQVANKCGT